MACTTWRSNTSKGVNLRDYINRKGPPDVTIAITIMRQIAAALQRASEYGFVHRDIKPENILLTRKGEVKVADFGLSRCFLGDQPLNITQSGVTMGTPLYMSPEQVQGHPVDPRSDIYSFGVTCYHMLAGEPPFKGQTPFEVALQHVQGQAQQLAEIRTDLPVELCSIVHKMMAKKPEDRYQTAREVLRDLTRLKDGQATSIQASLSQSATTLPAAHANEISGILSSETLPIGPPSRWRRLTAVAFILMAATALGAALHWKSNPSIALKPVDDDYANLEDPGKAARRELYRRLEEKGVRSDQEVTNAVLEIAMLYIHDSVAAKDPEVKKERLDKALELFDLDNLKKKPALVEAQSFFSQKNQYFPTLSTLGRGIVYAFHDMPAESDAEFKKVMVQPIVAKGKSTKSVDNFLWRYDRWKRMTADALERNAKNLSLAKLEDPLNRYRSYSSKMP